MTYSLKRSQDELYASIDQHSNNVVSVVDDEGLMFEKRMPDDLERNDVALIVVKEAFVRVMLTELWWRSRSD